MTQQITNEHHKALPDVKRLGTNAFEFMKQTSFQCTCALFLRVGRLDQVQQSVVCVKCGLEHVSCCC